MRFFSSFSYYFSMGSFNEFEWCLLDEIQFLRKFVFFFSSVVVIFFPAVDRYGLKLDLHAWLWNESKPIDCYFDRAESQICTNVCGGVRHFFLHRIDSRADKRTNVLTEARVQRGSAVLEYSKAFPVLHTFFYRISFSHNTQAVSVSAWLVWQ